MSILEMGVNIISGAIELFFVSYLLTILFSLINKTDNSNIIATIKIISVVPIIIPYQFYVFLNLYHLSLKNFSYLYLLKGFAFCNNPLHQFDLL